MAYVYCHYKIGSHPDIFYIGVGGLNKFDDYKRAKTIKKRSNLWKWMASKVDWDWEILEDNLTKEQALAREKVYVAAYGRYDQKVGVLSNLTDGGEGGCGGGQALKGRKRDPEIFKKGKETLAKKGGYKHSEKAKLKISKAMKGENNPFYGKSHTEEFKNKSSERMKLLTGNKNPFFGKKQSQKVLDRVRTPVFNTETGIFYDSVLEASLSTNIKYGSFRGMLNGRSKNKTNFIQI